MALGFRRLPCRNIQGPRQERQEQRRRQLQEGREEDEEEREDQEEEEGVVAAKRQGLREVPRLGPLRRRDGPAEDPAAEDCLPEA